MPTVSKFSKHFNCAVRITKDDCFVVTLYNKDKKLVKQVKATIYGCRAAVFFSDGTLLTFEKKTGTWDVTRDCHGADLYDFAACRSLAIDLEFTTPPDWVVISEPSSLQKRDIPCP